MKKTAVLITVILLIQANIYSQTMEVGLFGGGSYYLGDINPGVHFQQIKPAAGLIARYNVDTRWSLRLSAITGKVAGDDAISKKVLNRDLVFESPITEIATVVEFNFFPYVNGSAYNYFTPYIFGGASVFWFNPQVDGIKLAELVDETDPLRTYYGTENVKYNRHGLAIPFGIGVKYSVSQNIGLGFEWGMRKTFTDYIDDISTEYYLSNADFDADNLSHRLSDPQLAMELALAEQLALDGMPPKNPAFKRDAGEQRGNPKTMDWFNFVGISITVEFDIFNKTTCVDFTDGYRK